jgi:hypothetical protein
MILTSKHKLALCSQAFLLRDLEETNSLQDPQSTPPFIRRKKGSGDKS